MLEQSARGGSMPLALVVLIVLLGWNELMYVLSNPLLLLLLVTLGSLYYLVDKMGMTPSLLSLGNLLYDQAAAVAANAINQRAAAAVQRPKETAAAAASASRSKKDL